MKALGPRKRAVKSNAASKGGGEAGKPSSQTAPKDQGQAAGRLHTDSSNVLYREHGMALSLQDRTR